MDKKKQEKVSDKKSITDERLRIIFRKSTSSFYDKVIKYAKTFSKFSQNESINELIINNKEISLKKKQLQQIFDYILSWKYTEIYFDNIQIDKNKILEILNILDCCKERENFYGEEKYCFHDEMEWYCRFMKNIFRHLPVTWGYYDNREGRFWFDFGRFDTENIWIIDKEKLRKVLYAESEESNLSICPYFDFKKIDQLLSDLPDRINLETDTAWGVREKDIDNGFIKEKKRINVLPKNIIEDELNNRSGWHHVFSNNEKNKTDEKIEIERNIPNVTFNDIGGLENIMTTIREVIELPIKRPEIFEHLGIVPHKGILLYGPPGCGKTLIAKAIANEINAHFISINGPELLSKYYGESEENLRGCFAEAKKCEPSVIYFDEIDSMAKERTGESSLIYSAQMVNQLLTLMDGVQDYGNIRIIASTNKPELIDGALLRPGRFDYHIELKKPTMPGCLEIFSIALNKMPVSPDFDITTFSKKLYGLTGADIAFVAREGAYNCIRRMIDVKKTIDQDISIDLSKLFITERDFNKALSSVSDRD